MQTILVVEDESLIAEILVAILSDQGYEVIVASNGQEAVEILRGTHPDLIISDMMMPGMDGRELLKYLRTHAEYSIIPFVLMSAAVKPSDIDGYKYGAFIQKPFSFDEVILAVTTLLG